MTLDALGNEVHIGDLIAYGSGQGDAKAGFRVGLVINTERPTVVPFRKGYAWSNDIKKGDWVRMRTFAFPPVKKGDFVIITEKVLDKDLEHLIYNAQIEYKMRMI